MTELGLKPCHSDSRVHSLKHLTSPPSIHTQLSGSLLHFKSLEFIYWKKSPLISYHQYNSSSDPASLQWIRKIPTYLNHCAFLITVRSWNKKYDGWQYLLTKNYQRMEQRQNFPSQHSNPLHWLQPTSGPSSSTQSGTFPVETFLYQVLWPSGLLDGSAACSTILHLWLGYTPSPQPLSSQFYDAFPDSLFSVNSPIPLIAIFLSVRQRLVTSYAKGQNSKYFRL